MRREEESFLDILIELKGAFKLDGFYKNYSKNGKL
jgi:hypothetical protein